MKKMIPPLKHSFTALLLFVLTFSYGFEGQLQLLTKNYEHPALKTWAQENEPLLSGLQRGMDLMKLVDGGGELRLVQSADSLSQAHGFLSFDYRMYGVTTSYTLDDAHSLLPKILGSVQSTFNVGSSIPFVLMISWFQHQTNQADILLYIQWNGFSRLVEYDANRRSLIKSLTEGTYIPAKVANPYVPQQAMAAALSKFKKLLDPVLPGYFVVEGKKYTANDTLFTCQCAQSIKLTAYRSNDLPFTKTGQQNWNNARYLFDNVGEVDRMKASSDAGLVIQVTFTDSIGVQYAATLRIYVVDVDFEDANGSRFSFDENGVQQYPSFKRDPQGDTIRRKLIPKSFSDDVIVKITPASVAHKVYFKGNSSIVNPTKASSARQIVNISHTGNAPQSSLFTYVGSLSGCNYGSLSLIHTDTVTIKLKIIWVTADSTSSVVVGQIPPGLITGAGQIFGHVGVYVKVKSVEAIRINYDLNRDSLLQEPEIGEITALLNEYNEKQGSSSDRIEAGTNIVGVFIVKGFSGQTTRGVSLTGTGAVAQPMSFIGGGRTLAHEIGHAVFYFVDLIKIIPPGTDPENLMSYDDHRGTMLRMFQWEQIHNALKSMRRR